MKATLHGEALRASGRRDVAPPSPTASLARATSNQLLTPSFPAFL